MTVPPAPILACLGGLTHDLGKLGLYAGEQSAQSSQYQCQSPGQHLSFGQCPTCPGRYGTAHVALGARLLQDTLPAFADLHALVARHHAPADADLVLQAVRLGGQLSAAEADKEIGRPTATANQAPPLLQNPLSASHAPTLLPPAPLSANVGLGNPRPDAATARHAYHELQESLRLALVRASDYAGDDYTALVDHVLGAVYRGALTAPAADDPALADVSLASHLHLAGAFAAALAFDGVQELNAEQPVVGLVAGDLSGIQEFLHTVPSKGAARSLRARSMFLQLVALVAARYVARSCGMPNAAVVSHTGGNFLLVVPRSQLPRVTTARTDLERVFFAAFGPRLNVALASVEASPAELGDFLAVRSRLGEELSSQKNRRYASSAETLGVFEPRRLPSAGEACRACGRDAERWLDQEEGRLCASCDSLEDLGQQLPRQRYLTLEDVPAYGAAGWESAFAALGVRVRFWEQPPPPPFGGTLFALDSAALHQVPCARFLPIGRAIPSDPSGAPLDFDALAGQSAGRPGLAVAKVDVDDLGLVLPAHFAGERPAGPARFAAFSTFLSLYFEGYLSDRAASADFPFIYMVYAGGDDLLCAGPPAEVLRFVEEARGRFDIWTGHNPALHFSAGVSVADAHRPVVAGLEAAEQLLAESKAFTRDGLAKNAATLGDWAGTWDEIREVLRLRDQLIQWLGGEGGESGGAARSLLHRLQALRELDPGNGTVQYGPALWRAYYDLSRFADRHQALKDDLMELYKSAVRPGRARQVALAARLAEISTAVHAPAP